MVDNMSIHNDIERVFYTHEEIQAKVKEIGQAITRDYHGKNPIFVGVLKGYLMNRNPKSIKIVTLFDKPSRRKAPIYSDYAGYEVPNEFIVGYGLDYAEKYRNLPYIGVLKPEIYN